MSIASLAVRAVLAAAVAAPLASAGDDMMPPLTQHVFTARHLGAHASVKVFNPAGAVRLIGWKHDSLEVRGDVSAAGRYSAAGDANGAKISVEEAAAGAAPVRSDITVYLPQGAQVAVKTVNGDIRALDVSGWFYTIAGAVHIAGAAASIEVDAMRGDVDLGVSVPWLHVRAGGGHVVLHGAAEDADVSTISGTLDISAGGIQRGQFASVSGDISWAGAPAPGAILDFSDHSGAVDLAMPASASGTFVLSSVTGTIANGFAQAHPVSQTNRSMRLTLGGGGADVAVRTFKGVIRVRPR